MTDVRLTATNPEDSSVVPVACNEKGELKLEEPLDYEFDGNLDGDLNVSGSINVNGGVFKNKLTIERDNSSPSGPYLETNLEGVRTALLTGAGNLYLGMGEYTGKNGNIQLNSNGNGKFLGDIQVNREASGDKVLYGQLSGTTTSDITADGSARFSGDVTVGSRSKSWMLVEQGGLCHMVEQTRLTADSIDPGFSVAPDADLNDPGFSAAPEYPKLRDVFNELNLIEEALNTVMEKLRLTPPAGWEVWDGSDNL